MGTKDNKKQSAPEERLLKAVFGKDYKPAKDDDPDDEYDENFPDTNAEKIGYALHTLTKSLEYISPALLRLRRLDSLYSVSKKDCELPDIIAHNEARMALEHLKHVRLAVYDAFDETMTVYKRTDKVYEKSEALKKEEADNENL